MRFLGNSELCILSGLVRCVADKEEKKKTVSTFFFISSKEYFYK